jgi:hypothetical protein
MTFDLDQQKLLERLTAVEDRLAIIDIRARYCHLLDAQEWDTLLDLFTGDIYFKGMLPANGHAELLEFFKGLVPGAMSVSWHRSFSETIDLDGDRASGQCQWDAPCVIDGVPMLCSGRYDDEFVRCEDGKWRFSKRVLTFYFFTPLSEGWQEGATPVLDEL